MTTPKDVPLTLQRFLLFVLFGFLPVRIRGAPCTVCSDGSSVTLVDQGITLPDPYASITTCGQLDLTLPFSGLESDSMECQAIQNVGSYCGCPIQANACQLCEEGQTLQNSNQTISFEPIPSSLITPTCGLAQAFLHSTTSQTDECLSHKVSLQTDCICVDRSSSTIDDNDDTRRDENKTTIGEEKCIGMCADGSDITWPEKELGYILSGLDLSNGFVFDDNSTITCGFIESFVRLVSAQDKLCNEVQYLLAGICGCPTLAANPCRYCGDEQLPEPNRMVYSFQRYGFPPGQCEDIRLFLEQRNEHEDICQSGVENGFLCGCGGEYNLDFRNDIQWAPRISGFLSLFGSSFILVSVWRQYRKGNLSMYHQLIAAISLGDLICSLTFALYPLAFPEYNEYGEFNGIRGAVGTDATCKLSGFMVQTGVTAVIYQISLSSYYLLVIYYGWSETRIRKYAWVFHLPLLIGLGLAFAGLPFYEDSLFLCYFPHPDITGSHTLVLIFLIIPISISVLVTSVNLTVVYFKVRRQVAASNQWRMSLLLQLTRMRSSTSRITQRRFGGIKHAIKNTFQNMKMKANEPPRARPCLEREMFWQCFLYLGAFYLTWSFQLLSQVDRLINNKPLWICIWLFAPAQGFFNFLVYIRPTVAQKYREWRHRKWTRNQTEKNSSAVDKREGPGQHRVTAEETNAVETVVSQTEHYVTEQIVKEADETTSSNGIDDNSKQIGEYVEDHALFLVEEGECDVSQTFELASAEDSNNSADCG